MLPPSVVLRPLAVLAACSLAPVCSHADELVNDVQQLLGLSLQDLIATPVVTASRKAETRDQTPAHILVLTREQIRSRRYHNLADLLEELPGVHFQRGTKSSQFNQFSFQGYVGPNKLLVLQDGIRIGHPAGGNFPIAENLSLHHAKQVEVVFGPAAALYGADAVAGVMNIVTDNPAQQSGATGSASISTGRFGSREASFFTAASVGEHWGISAGGHSQHAERAPLDRYYPEYFQKPDALADNRYVGNIRSHSLFARLDWGERLTLGVHRYVFNSLTSTGDPATTAIYDRGAQWQTTTDVAYARYNYRPRTDLHASLTIDHAQMQVDPRAYYFNSYNNFQKGYSYVRGKRTGLGHSLRWDISPRHQVQGSLGWQTFDAIEASSLPQPYNTAYGPGGQGLLMPGSTLPLVPPSARFRNLSAYMQWQAQWSDALSTMMGARMDRHSVYGSAVNPRLGLVFKPHDQHVFKALYGEAFRAPSPEESFSSMGRFDGSQDDEGRYIGTNFRIPNASLEPEKARTLSLTWDWRPTPQLNVISNLYRSRISNLVVTQTLTGTYNHAIPGASLINPETKDNAGEQWQTGLDISAQWRFRLNPRWTGELWGSASWIHGRIDTGDGTAWRIPYVASHQLKLGASLLWRDRISITPKLRWSSSTTHARTKPPAGNLLLPAHCSSTPQAPERCSTPGAAVMDLHLGWHKLLDGRASLWLDVHNLLDKRYFAAGGAGSRTFWDMPQQPRHWQVTLDYRF